MLSGRRKLLLADDSPTVQKVISLFLEEEGIEVVAVGDGREALRLLEEERPPDILIADVWMPGPDGYELCERVKSDERLRHIPVILLVSKFEPFNEAEARRVGADTVLTKPFQSIRDLVSRVGSLLGGGPKREETAPERTPREESAAEASHARAESQATDADARAPHAAAQADERAVAFDSELAQPFGDPGADDELIEAKPAESFFEPARAEAAERAAAPEEIEVSEQAEEFETIAHAPDVLAARHDAAHEPFGTNGQAAISHEAQHAGESLMPARSSFAARAADAAAADDALLDLGQFEPPTSGHAAEADDFILDLEEDLPAPHAAQSLFAQPDEPSAFAEASHGASASSFGESASSFDRSAQPHDAAQGHDAAAWEVVMQEPEVFTQDERQFSASPRPAHEAGPAPRGFVEPSVVPAEEPV
ncbi:MAG: response regulator, partial [Acidobacteriota bacterium]|nr:response regulator [Acidobacteriota bacterium]